VSAPESTRPGLENHACGKSFVKAGLTCHPPARLNGIQRFPNKNNPAERIRSAGLTQTNRNQQHHFFRSGTDMKRVASIPPARLKT
jgi:hypothetical protein